MRDRWKEQTEVGKWAAKGFKFPSCSVATINASHELSL